MGALNEDKAKQQYQSQASIEHLDFKVRQCGLHIDMEHPYLGATPDDIVRCDCCGDDIL